MNVWRSMTQSALLAISPRRQKKRLLRWFIDRFQNEPFLFRGSYGLVFLLQARNTVDAEIVRFGMHERHDVDFLVQHMRAHKADLFLDIGANLGTYSLAVAKETDCPEIIAFEPDPLNRAKLYGNIYLNDFGERIRVRDEALSDAAGTATLHAARADNEVNDNTGASSLEPGHHIGIVHTMEIKTARLDDLLNVSGKAIVIKMDIEGHEATALAGMTRVIAQNHIWLQIEILPRYAERTRAALESLGLVEQPHAGSGVDFIFASPS